MRALLIDLDDTLLDYSGGVDASWEAACAACCTPSVGVEAETLVRAVAEARQWFWSDPERSRQQRVDMARAWQGIVAHALTRLGVTCDGLDAAIAERFAALRREAMRLFPDARAALETLRGRGIPLGLVTNGDARLQRDKISRHDLARFFDVIVIESEFGAGKPDAAVFRHALGALRVAPSEAWMVGDNLEADVEGAQRLGIRAAWIDREERGLPPAASVRPDRIIRTFGEILEEASTKKPRE